MSSYFQLASEKYWLEIVAGQRQALRVHNRQQARRNAFMAFGAVVVAATAFVAAMTLEQWLPGASEAWLSFVNSIG